MNNTDLDHPILILKEVLRSVSKGSKEAQLVSNYLLDDPRFRICSGSSKPFQHHYGDGGLARHTMEVVDLCMSSSSYFCHNIDRMELFFAALFHDAGKMYDYQKMSYSSHDFEMWGSSKHKRLIHHISRSAIIWTEAADNLTNHNRYYEPVLHAILAHHGFREAGSPVAPKTRVAWLVYLCDNMSARMDDADTFDIVHKDKSAS